MQVLKFDDLVIFKQLTITILQIAKTYTIYFICIFYVPVIYHKYLYINYLHPFPKKIK